MLNQNAVKYWSIFIKEGTNRRRLVLCYLDDIPNVCPKDKKSRVLNLTTLNNDCENINVNLAKNCPIFEKAFELSTQGRVLGIDLNTQAFPNEKISLILKAFKFCFENKLVPLASLEKVNGKINNLGIMISFMTMF